MLSEKLGHVFDKPLNKITRKISFSPNALTFVGFLITILASFVLASSLFWGGILMIAGSMFDILDGVVARTQKKTSRFGAYLDSVLDRYSDAFIFLAIAWNLGSKNNHAGVLLCLGSLVGALLISYTRARAEGLGIECRLGLMERPERMILLSFGVLSGFIVPVLWIMLILTHFTVFQRIHHVWKTTL